MFEPGEGVRVIDLEDVLPRISRWQKLRAFLAVLRDALCHLLIPCLGSGHEEEAGDQQQNVEWVAWFCG